MKGRHPKLSQQRTSREGLANVGDKIVRMLDSDRHVEGEVESAELDCLSNFCVGWSAESKGGAKTSALVFPQPRDGSDHPCSDTKPRADRARKRSHENVNSIEV